MSAKRVVIDTNVIVSGLISNGPPQKILQAWIMGKFAALMSEELRNEINQVLSRVDLIVMDRKRRVLLGTLMNQAINVLPRKIKYVTLPDEDDHFLLELAIAGEALAIVTGEDKLVKTRRVSGIDILNPREFCRRFKIS